MQSWHHQKSVINRQAFIQKGLVNLAFLQTDQPNYFPELKFWFRSKWLKSCQIETWSYSECSNKALQPRHSGCLFVLTCYSWSLAWNFKNRSQPNEWQFIWEEYTEIRMSWLEHLLIWYEMSWMKKKRKKKLGQENDLVLLFWEIQIHQPFRNKSYIYLWDLPQTMSSQNQQFWPPTSLFSFK